MITPQTNVSLEQQFHQIFPERGTDGSRFNRIIEGSSPTGGKELALAADKVSRQFAGLLAFMSGLDVGLTGSYEAGYPAVGRTSKIGRKRAAANGYIVDPNAVTASNLGGPVPN